MFSLRIVNVDHYMSPPKPGLDLTYSQFRGNIIKSVPIIRIFGATPSGDKTCLHIHGVFPYILVPFSGAQDAGSVMYQLASSLDKAINVSLGSSHSNKQYVFKITQVSGRPFYGYHGQDHQYLKIFFYTPLIIKRACDLLQNGAVCGTCFQIHEGHVPFTLQFFIDYNLYGMSFIDVKKVVYRKGVNQPGVPVGTFSKESVCKLEADAVAVDILNRIKVEGEMAVNPGLAAIWEEEKKRLNKDMLDASSLRPSPQLAMSEVLLKEKLLENVKHQGRCKALLKDNIPYPAETQRSNSSDIFDASMIDTHSVVSLVSSQVFRDENTLIDEEIIHSLTQNLPMSSGEISLLAALDDLAAHNEVSQNVEEDSILGSQAVADSVSDDEDDILNFSLSLPSPFQQDSCDDSDTSFEDNIPQLDGVGDIVKKEKKNVKKSEFENKENSCNNEVDATNSVKSNETSLLESENREIIDEVFQDIQPFCSPLHDNRTVFEDGISLSDLSLFNDSESEFDVVLKGDPSFTCKDSTFSEEIFLDQKIGCFNSNPIINVVNCNSSQNTPLKEYMPKVSELEKSSVLSDSNEDLLGMAHLDQLFYEDLDEGMGTECENNPEWSRSTRVEQDSYDQLFKEENNKNRTDVDKVVPTNFSQNSPSIENTKTTTSKRSGKSINLITDALGEDNTLQDTNCPRLKTSSNEDKTATTEKSQRCDYNQQFVCNPQHLLIKQAASITRMFKIKKKKITFGKCDDWDMTNAEVDIYFSQLSKLTFELSKRTVSENTDPVSWPSIRRSSISEQNIVKCKRTTRKCKSRHILKQLGRHKFSKKEMNKLTSCHVLLKKLSESESNSVLKPKDKTVDLKDKHQHLENPNKKTPKTNLDATAEIANKGERIGLSLTLEQKAHNKPQSNSNQPALSSSSIIKEPKKSHNCSIAVHDLKLVKSCQVILERKENDVLSKAKYESIKQKSLTQPNKLNNSNCSKLSKNKKCQSQISLRNKLSKNSFRSDPNKTIGGEKAASKCKPEKDLKKNTKTSLKKYNTRNVILKDLREVSHLSENNKKFCQNNKIKSLLKSKNNLNPSLSLKKILFGIEKHYLKSNQKENLKKVVTGTSNNNMPESSIISSFKNEKKLKNSHPSHYKIHPSSQLLIKLTPLKMNTHNLKPFKKRDAILKCDLNQNLKEKEMRMSQARRTRLNVLSLDGTCDTSSSSDEQVSEPSTDVKCTPKKKRKSSNETNTPKSKYVPLQVEIKKSPTIKLERISVKTENKSDFKETLRLSPRSESKHEETSRSVQTCKEKPMVPVVKIEKLSEGIKPTDTQKLPNGNYLKMNTKAYPLIKKLKISVKRCSTDAQVNDGSDSLRAKHMMYRRSSLPVTSKENEMSREMLGETMNKEQSVDNFEIKSLDVDKDNKARKMLVFSDQNLSSQEKDQDISSPSDVNERILNRRISKDMFEINSESNITEFDSFLSDEYMASFNKLNSTETKISNLEDDFAASTSNPVNNNNQTHDVRQLSILSAYSQVCGFKPNQYNLENSTKFTPFLNPPTRATVESTLRELGLPEEVNEEPFYSDPSDVTKGYEVGKTTVKLTSKSVVHLEEFRGAFYSNKDVIPKRSRYSKVTNKITLTPLKDPPTLLHAKEWLRSKAEIKTQKEIEKPKTVNQIVIPLSQGDMSGNESNELSLTISQCSPFSGKEFSDTSNHSTPESRSSTSRSPLMASTPINQLVTSRLTKRSLSKVSLSFAKTLPTIQEEPCPVPAGSEHHDLQCDSLQSQNASVKLSGTKIKQILSDEKSPASVSCRIDNATPENSGNYKMELENLQDVKLNHEYQYLTILTMELHVHTRGEMKPNPDYDAICCIFYNIDNDQPDPASAHITGAICVAEDTREKMPQMHCRVTYVQNEQALIEAFIREVKACDPDIFVGYEIELLSWGYLLQRASVLNINLKTELSRVKTHFKSDEEFKEINKDDDFEFQLPGRIVLNLWRFLRHEVALQSYTFENIAYHILHQRVPLFSFHTLNTWWSHRTKLYRWQVFEHYVTRVEGTVRIMKQLDMVGRTSEFARLFGIQFFDVLSRGSQFRVESMMLRLVKPLNYVAVSPSVRQRAAMRAPQSLPLIMEPQSRFYSDPVIVLDFQSLYPSIIIAYNYCYSTCLGRVEHLGRSELFEFGCTQLRVPLRDVVRLKDELNFSPCGVAYVKQSVVRGVLPRMLEEILNTRLMVKQSMKENKEDKTLQRVLHNRQLGLKLIANVTYGYTGANFSGRMPCIEVGDSVVSKARETLERAINLVSNNSEWGARVIYGDTDSMFVLVPGRTRQEAFRIGAEIAAAVTNSNPQPIKLKLEKVYQPCILQTKKRYVGFMYESPDQKMPVYDAKGIETVRRDGCPAVAKILEKSLRLLFESRDVSLVKRFVTRQFGKVLSGRVSVQELTFAREYRGAAGYRPNACVPALELAKQWRAVDPRAEPRVGERVPYVIVAGPPGLPLIRLVRSPATLLTDASLKINAEYYISRVIIPPLDRCFSLIGAHVASWYAEYPRKQQVYLPGTLGEGGKKATISQYFITVNCVVCDSVTTSGVCETCQKQPQTTAVTLASQLWQWEHKLHLVTKVCQSCCGRRGEVDCVSLDCPVLYRRCQASRDLTQADYVRTLYHQYTQPTNT